jgi:uncharacterized membrane protein
MTIHMQELLLTSDSHAKIVDAVKAAEERAFVDIHVHIEASSRYPEARASDLLRAATATRGVRRPAMILYLLTHERRCFVITDKTLRPLEGTRVWRDVANRLMLDLLHGKFGDGMADAIGRFSHIIGGHFPAIMDIPTRSVAR